MSAYYEAWDKVRNDEELRKKVEEAASAVKR